MAFGLDARLPLYNDSVYGFYALNQTIKDNTKQKIKMLMLTSPGERVMLPNYGIGLRNYLFENKSEFEIVEKIREQVKVYLEDITVVSLEVNRATDRTVAQIGHKNSLAVIFTYLINGINLQDTLSLVETQIG